MSDVYRNRTEAGQKLAEQLDSYRNVPDVIVLGLPRGGIPVAYEIAKSIGAPLDALIVRKLGFPGQPELAMGAIASGGVRVENERIVRETGTSEEVISRVEAYELKELQRREQFYRGDRPFPDLRGKRVILVDDGLATGSTMRAALIAVQKLHASQTVVAVPVAPPRTIENLQEIADEVICPSTPRSFFGIGEFYSDFSQTSDDEVKRLLNDAAVVSTSNHDKSDGGKLAE